MSYSCAGVAVLLWFVFVEGMGSDGYQTLVWKFGSHGSWGCQLSLVGQKKMVIRSVRWVLSAANRLAKAK